MCFKKTAGLFLALLIFWQGYAQLTCNGTLTGKILDEAGQPVIGASVILTQQQTGQQTDLSGNFRFEKLCPGKHKISVQYVGYATVELEVDVYGQVNQVIRMKEAVTQLSEVVIQHHDDSRTEHATNFVQLQEKQLSELAGKTLGESLKEVPGVNSIQSGPGIFKPVIHGVHSQRVLILNHGIRQEGQQWGAEHAPEIDPFIAANLVVIKDASAIKYGSDAQGGVIVVNPPELPETARLGGSLTSVAQSNGRSGTLSGMLEGGIKNHDGWGWRVQGTAKRTGDFHTSNYNLTNTGIKELNFSAATGYHKETVGFDVFFSHFQTEIGILKGTAIGNLDDLVNAMERPVPEYTRAFSYSIGEPRQEVRHNLLKLNGHIETGYGEWRLQYGFQNNNRKEFDVRRGQLSKIPAIDLELNTHTLDLEWETHHSDKRTISVGMNGLYQNNKNVFGTQRIPFIPNFNTISGGLFGVTKLFFPKWTVDLGARYDYRHNVVKGFDYKNAFYRTTFDFNNVSASAGATVRLSKNQTVNLNISSAWRPPHVSELFSLGTHQSAASNEYGLLLDATTNEVRNIKDVNFKTEQALKFVGTWQRRWSHVSLDVSPYVNYIFNYIYLQPSGITNTIRGVFPYFRYTQTDALFLGTDVTGTIKVADHIRVIPKASWLRASDHRHNDFLILIPSNRYEVVVRYEKPSVAFFRDFYLESKTRYVAKQGRAPRVVTVREIKEAQEQDLDPFADDRSNFDFMPPPDGYWLWNLAAGVSLKGNKTRYDFRIASENLLNQQYREYTNRFRYYADELGRNILLTVKCIF